MAAARRIARPPEEAEARPDQSNRAVRPARCLRSLRAEGFNLTNHANIVGRNGVYGNATDGTALPTFGAALCGVNNVEPVRAFQYQARVAF